MEREARCHRRVLTAIDIYDDRRRRSGSVNAHHLDLLVYSLSTVVIPVYSALLDKILAC